MIKQTLNTLAAAVLAAATGSTTAANLVPEQRIESTLDFHAETLHDGRISAVVENESTEPVKDVVVLVKYNWLWKDELNPGPDSPEWVDFVTLGEELEPGEATTFVYTPGGPLPSRDDGFFFPTAEVVGMTVVE